MSTDNLAGNYSLVNMPLHLKRDHLFKKVEYPLRYQAKNLWRTVCIQFGVLFTFLALYRPFGVYEPELKFNYYLICGLHALSPSIIVFLYFSLVDYYRSTRRNRPEWNLFKEYYQLAIVIFLIGIASFSMRGLIYNNPYNWSLRYLWEELRNCYLAGSLFYFYLLLTNVYFQSKALHEEIKQTNTAVFKTSISETDIEVFIHTQVKQDDFSFNPHELLFVKADGNYVELTAFCNEQLKTKLKRISLRQLESRLADYPFLFKCHRSYLVNMMHIEQISGNSQGYSLSFRQSTDKIPVSRTLLNSFDSRFEQIRGTVSN